MRQGPPSIQARITSGPRKPWEQRLTALQVMPLLQPSYESCQGNWQHMSDIDLNAVFHAVRPAAPGAAQATRTQMISTMLGWFEAQEVALAWAVVKYAELVSAAVRQMLVY
jgi:hypothetical protein